MTLYAVLHKPTNLLMPWGPAGMKQNSFAEPGDNRPPRLWVKRSSANSFISHYCKGPAEWDDANHKRSRVHDLSKKRNKEDYEIVEVTITVINYTPYLF